MRWSSARSSGWSAKRTVTRRSPRGGLAVLGRAHAHEHERLGARVLDLAGLARSEEDAGVRLERVRFAVDLDRAAARDDVEDLLAAVEHVRPRATGLEADHDLLQPLAAVRAVEDDARLRGVALRRAAEGALSSR